MEHKIVSAIAAAALMLAAVMPADAARKERKYRSQDRVQQSLSLDGRNTGRPRTCGHDTFVYDGWGVPMGPYCH